MSKTREKNSTATHPDPPRRRLLPRLVREPVPGAAGPGQRHVPHGAEPQGPDPAPVGGRGVALDELGGGGRGGHDKVLDDVGAREGVVLFWVFFVLRRKRGPERERAGEK